jgi:hypothetical protein
MCITHINLRAATLVKLNPDISGKLKNILSKHCKTHHQGLTKKDIKRTFGFDL